MQKLLTFFSAKILAYLLYLMIKVYKTYSLTNDIISFKQLGADIFLISPQTHVMDTH